MWVVRLGGGGEGDGEPEGFELADVVTGFAAGIGAAGVVAGAEVVVAGGGVGEQVPDDDQDGAGDGDQGAELAAAAGDAPVQDGLRGEGLLCGRSFSAQPSSEPRGRLSAYVAL